MLVEERGVERSLCSNSALLPTAQVVARLPWYETADTQNTRTAAVTLSTLKSPLGKPTEKMRHAGVEPAGDYLRALGHQDGVHYVDDTIGLDHVRDGYLGCAALGVGEFD